MTPSPATPFPTPLAPTKLLKWSSIGSFAEGFWVLNKFAKVMRCFH